MDFIDIGLYAGYFLVIVAAIGVIVLPLINSMNDPKKLLKPIAAIAALGILFLLGYAVSGNEVTALYTKHNVGETASQMIGAALTTTYVLMFAAFVGIIYSEFSKVFK